MLKKLLFLFIFPSFSVFIAFCDERAIPPKIETALLKSVSFDASSEQIQKLFNQKGPPSFVKIKNILGKNNLSSFLLTASPELAEEYEITPLYGSEENARNQRIKAIFSLLKGGKSLVQFKYIKDLNWLENANGTEGNGSFTFFQNNVWHVNCIFSAKKIKNNWQIIELLIPRKGDTDKRQALVVFNLQKKKVLGNNKNKTNKNLSEAQEKALLKAISFDGTPEKIKQTTLFMKKNKDQLGELMIAYLKSKLGNKNLSSFIFFIQENTEDYEIEALMPYGWRQRWDDIYELMEKGESIVKIDNLSEIHWTINEKIATGSFVFFNKKIYKIKCLFIARKRDDNWVIHKLGIAKKGSNDLKESFHVFDLDKEEEIKNMDTLKAILTSIELRKLKLN